MRNLLKIQLVIYSILSLNACSQVTNPAIEYEACCGSEPYEYNVELPDSSHIYIYIPNVFTPNGDGINDYFHPIFNNQIDHFEYMVISIEDAIGNTTLLYQAENIDSTNLNEKSWNGQTQNNSFHKGSFNYAVYCVPNQGQAFIIKGKSCSVLCGADAIFFQNNNGCFYSTQADSTGRLITTINNNEINCFH